MSSSDSNSSGRHPPRVGQIVEFHSSSTSNGTNVSPAVVTRVWGPDCINCKVFPDCGEVRDETSVSRAYHNGYRYGFVE
jgi:hypothetical protein